MRKNLAAVVAVAVAAALLTLPADARPKKPKRPDAQRQYEIQRQTRRWMAASPGGHVRAGSKRSNTMGSGCLTVPTAIDVVAHRFEASSEAPCRHSPGAGSGTGGEAGWKRIAKR
jgi:hypothetical protein